MVMFLSAMAWNTPTEAPRTLSEGFTALGMKEGMSKSIPAVSTLFWWVSHTKHQE
jgi:hypothetical protein